MDASNKDVEFDDVNVGDGENKVDLCDVYIGGGYCYDGGGVDDVDEIDANGRDEANCG